MQPGIYRGTLYSFSRFGKYSYRNLPSPSSLDISRIRASLYSQYLYIIPYLEIWAEMRTAYQHAVPKVSGPTVYQRNYLDDLYYYWHLLVVCALGCNG
jgi:hypothetical protein